MRTSALLAVALLAITLTGCQTDDPTIVPQPEPSTTPLFASEEEALAAAEEAFAAYLAVSDQIFADGGAEPERLLSVATEEVLDLEKQGYEEFATQSLRAFGATRLDQLVLQSADLNADSGDIAVTLYACIDITDVDVVDETGASVVSEGRADINPFEAAFIYDGESLLLAEKSYWTGDNFCL